MTNESVNFREVKREKTKAEAELQRMLSARLRSLTYVLCPARDQWGEHRTLSFERTNQATVCRVDWK